MERRQENGVLVEMMRQGDEVLIEELEITFNKCLDQEVAPED